MQIRWEDLHQGWTDPTKSLELILAELLEAIRASRTYDSTTQGFRYRAESVEVDAAACDRVQPGMLGPVLMKMDVAVEAKP